MQQHPIPQNVMSVEFQLVGNLTLRQFAYIAVGGMLVFTLFVLPINDFIKWSLILLIGGLSASLAWLPINDITFDRWVVAFFRAINSPTKRIWRKEVKELPIFAQDYAQNLLNRAASLPTADRTKLEEYLATLRASQPKSDLDLAEQAYLESLPFEEGGAPHPTAPLLGPQPAANLAEEVLPPVSLPVEEVSPEPRVVEEDLTKPALLQPTVKPVITVHMPDKNIYVKRVSTTTVNRQLHSLSSLEGTIVLPVRGEKTFDISEDLKRRLYPEELAETPAPPPPPVEVSPPVAAAPPQPEIPQPPPTQPGGPDLAYIKEPVPAQPDSRPQTDITAMEKKLAAEAAATREKLLKKPVPPKAQSAPAAPPQPEAKPTSPPKVDPKPEPARVSVPDRSKDTVNIPTTPPKAASQTSGNVVTPSPAVGKMAPPAANVPNVLVGLVRDQSGLLLVDVVIIVKDPDGEPVRALKTNKVGQFAISTPLPNGRYTIDLEKDGYKFDTIAVDLEGQIFTPIEIKAK